jgi:hypothetical protein
MMPNSLQNVCLQFQGCMTLSDFACVLARRALSHMKCSTRHLRLRVDWYKATNVPAHFTSRMRAFFYNVQSVQLHNFFSELYFHSPRSIGLTLEGLFGNGLTRLAFYYGDMTRHSESALAGIITRVTCRLPNLQWLLVIGGSSRGQTRMKRMVCGTGERLASLR